MGLDETSIPEAVSIGNSAIQKYGRVIENHTEYSIREFSSDYPDAEDVQSRIRTAHSAKGQLTKSDYHQTLNKLVNELYFVKDVILND